MSDLQAAPAVVNWAFAVEKSLLKKKKKRDLSYPNILRPTLLCQGHWRNRWLKAGDNVHAPISLDGQI